MTKKIYLLFLVFILSVIVLSGNIVQADNTLAQESIEVNVRVPVMQKLEIIEPISIESLNTDSEQSLIKENAGQIRVLSNTNWELQIVDNNNPNLNIFLRLNNDTNNEWKQISEVSSSFNGNQGKNDLSFDIKIETTGSEDLSNIDINQIQLSYTLTS